MRFRNRHRQAITPPRLLQQRAHTKRSLGAHAHRFDVGVSLVQISAVRFNRVAFQSLVEKSFACDIVIDAQNIRRTRCIEKRLKLLLANADPFKITPQRMVALEATT